MNHTHSEHVHVVIRNTLDKTPTRAAVETGTYFFQLAHCLPGVVSFTTAQPPNTAARPNASRHNKSTPVHPGAGLGTAVRPQQQPPRRLAPSPALRADAENQAARRHSALLFVHSGTATCRARPPRAPPPPHSPDPVPPAERWEPFKMAASPPPALTAPHRAHAAPRSASLPNIPRQRRPLASCSRSAPPGPAAPRGRRRPSAVPVPKSRRAAPPHPAPPGTEPPRRCRVVAAPLRTAAARRRREKKV